MEAESEEKQRRIYYQNIVYAVCNELDKISGDKPGCGIICGTVEHPSTAVQDRMKAITKEIMDLRTIDPMDGPIIKHFRD